MPIVAALVIAYLLGSVLPADLFARARGVDIRAVGTRNPGATNALQQLGWTPGLLTGLYDVSVGLVSMYVATLLGVTGGWVYVAGIVAIVGHCYPVFFGFRGGQGMAAATGMLVYGIGVALGQGWLGALGLGLLVLLALGVFAFTRSATDVGVFVAPVLLVEIVLGRPDWQFGLYMGFLTVFIWLTQLEIARTHRLFRLAEPVRARLARMRVGAR